MRSFQLALIVAVSSMVLGCATGRAKTAETPALQVPDPPGRTIAAFPAEPVEEPEPPPAPPAPPVRTGSRPPRPPARSEPGPTRTAPARPESPAATESRPAGAGAPPLATPQTADETEVERRIRETLTRASRALGQIDYAALSADAKTQYDTSKRFVGQAEDALRSKNYVFAGYLADKAETLARGLLGR